LWGKALEVPNPTRPANRFTTMIIYEDDNIIVKPSAIEGFGVFAKREFEKGEIVLIWHPTMLTKEKLSNVPEEHKRYVNILEGGASVLMNIPERYINSSDKPNTHVVRTTDVAIRDILVGEEITSNYSLK
jgi:SET domain-containing protein